MLHVPHNTCSFLGFNSYYSQPSHPPESTLVSSTATWSRRFETIFAGARECQRVAREANGSSHGGKCVWGAGEFPSRCPANTSLTKLCSLLGGKQKAPEQPALCCSLCPRSTCHTHEPSPGLMCHTQHPCQPHSRNITLEIYIQTASRTPATQGRHGPAASSAQALPGSTPVRAVGSHMTQEMGLQREKGTQALAGCFAVT